MKTLYYKWIAPDKRVIEIEETLGVEIKQKVIFKTDKNIAIKKSVLISKLRINGIDATPDYLSKLDLIFWFMLRKRLN